MNNTAASDTKVRRRAKEVYNTDYERTSKWERWKIKYLNVGFLGHVVFVIFRTVFLIGISYIILYPFFAKISSSFMSRNDFVDVTVKLIPRYPTLDTYRAIINDNFYFQALFNTMVLSVFCGFVQTLICTIIGYGFAKFNFKGNKLLFFIVIFTMVVPHETLQLSMFMKFRYFDIFGIFNLLGGGDIKLFGKVLGHLPKILPFTSLNLNNSYWPVALLSLGGLGFKNGLYIFMMRQFFKGFPNELEESAYIDGYSVYRTFWSIIIPNSFTMMITIFLFAFSWQWTDDFYTEIFFTTEGIKLMPDVVAVPKSLDTQYAGQNLYVAAIRNTCGLMIIAPLIIVYLFCQQFLVQGIERSGLTAE